LFSREEVARLITDSFEPVWESVRPVPIVRIDFGNGALLTRTLHGNIASLVCTAQGQVVDVLPGIYTPAVYLDRLKQFRLLATFATALPPDRRQAVLQRYHQRRLDELSGKAVAAGAARPRADAGKTKGVEDRLELVLARGNAQPVNPASEDVPEAMPADLADWKLLAEDTRQNETGRRRQIHALLAEAGVVNPKALTKRLYKEVLHADLDDPYLGLGPTLFANYPFSREEARP
jgi:hypothetical protein